MFVTQIWCGPEYRSRTAYLVMVKFCLGIAGPNHPRLVYIENEAYHRNYNNTQIMCHGSMHIMYVPEIYVSCLMLMDCPLSAYFDDVIPQQLALSNDGKQRLPALGD
jgi:hypothetical protein